MLHQYEIFNDLNFGKWLSKLLLELCMIYCAFWKFGGKFSFLIRKGKPSYKEDNEVICTSYYSSLKPVEGGEISISLGMCVLILLY